MEESSYGGACAPPRESTVEEPLLKPGELLLAVGTLGFKACSLSYQSAYHGARPSAMAPPQLTDWLKNVVTWPIPEGLAAGGLPLWTDWSRPRRLRWCIAAFALHAALILVHQILVALGGPLNA